MPCEPSAVTLVVSPTPAHDPVRQAVRQSPLSVNWPTVNGALIHTQGRRPVLPPCARGAARGEQWSALPLPGSWSRWHQRRNGPSGPTYCGAASARSWVSAVQLGRPGRTVQLECILVDLRRAAESLAFSCPGPAARRRWRLAGVADPGLEDVKVDAGDTSPNALG